MKHKDLVRTVAKETRQSRARVQDEIDEMVHQILQALRNGEPVELPGMGKLVGSKKGNPKGGRRRKPR